MLRVRAALSAVVLPLLVSCGGSDDGDAFAEALEQLPQVGDDGFSVISWADMAAAREANGFDAVPDPATDAAADLVVAMNGLADDSVVMTPLNGYDLDAAPAGLDNDLGVGWTSADAVAAVSGRGGWFNFYVNDGEVGPSDGLERDGDLYLLDDDGGQVAAVDDDRAVISTDADLARAWLDDDADTLADLDDVRAVAEALDDEEALAGAIYNLGERGVLGIGWIDDDGEPACVIVYGGFPGDVDDVRDGIDAGWPEVADRVEADDIGTEGDLVVVRGHQVDDVTAPVRLVQAASLPLPDAG